MAWHGRGRPRDPTHLIEPFGYLLVKCSEPGSNFFPLQDSWSLGKEWTQVQVLPMADVPDPVSYFLIACCGTVAWHFDKVNGRNSFPR